MAPAGTRRSRVALAVLALAASIVAPGCGTGRGDREWTDDGWRYAMGLGLYYRPDGLSSDPARIDERLPVAGAPSHGFWLEVQHTHPEGERTVIPAPDDYAWQAVATLDGATAEQLVAKGPAPSDLGSTAPIPDADVHAALLPPLREPAGSCPDGWMPVTVGTADMPDHTTSGDYIDLSVVCPSTLRLAVTTFDT